MMMIFLAIEDKFRGAKHPLWTEAYEHPKALLRRQKRVALVVAAMRLFAEVFEKYRAGAMDCIFWEDLREEELGFKESSSNDDFPVDQCAVM